MPNATNRDSRSPATQGGIKAALTAARVERGLKVAGTLLGLYVCVFLLQYFMLFPTVAREELAERARFVPSKLEGWQVLLSPAPSPDRTIGAVVRGMAPAASEVKVQVGTRTYTAYAGGGGLMEVEVRLTELIERVRVEARRLGAELGTSVDIEIDRDARMAAWGSLPPEVDLALLDESSSRVWLSGRALGWQPYTPGSQRDWRSGVYDAWLPLDAAWEVSFRAEDDNPSLQRSHTVRLGLLELTRFPRLPLGREIVVHFDRDEPTLDMTFRLPETHPALNALVQGDLAPYDFIGSVCGCALFPSGTVTQAVKREGAVAVVQLHGELGPSRDLVAVEQSRILDLPPTARLFFSDADSLTVHFRESMPRWFDTPLPARLDLDLAEWRGPLRERSIRVRVELPSQPPAPEEAAAPELPVADAEPSDGHPVEKPRPTLRDWVAKGPRALWVPPMDVLPWLAFAWLAWRRPFGVSRVWPPVFAALGVIGAFSLGDWIRRLADGLTTSWLERTVRAGLGSPGLYRLFADWDAGWLTFVALTAAMTPIYFRWLERCAARRRPYAAPRVRRRRMGTLVRIAWAAPWALLTGAWIASRTHRPWTDGVGAWLAGNYPRGYELQRLLELAAQARESWPRDGSGGWGETFTLVLQTEGVAVGAVGEIWRSYRGSFLVTACLLLPLALAISLRALAFASGWLLLVVRLCYESPGDLDLLTGIGPVSTLLTPVVTGLRPIAAVPWSLVLLGASLAGLAFVAQLLSRLSPPAGARPPVWKTAFLLVTTALLIEYLPGALLATAAGCVMLWILVWTSLRGARRLEPVRAALAHVAEHRRVYLLASLLTALVLAWPATNGDDAQLHDVSSLYYMVRALFDVPTLGLLLLLLKSSSDAAPAGGRRLEPGLVATAPLLFALFINRDSGVWMSVIPVSILVAWFTAQYWLFRPTSDRTPDSEPLERTPERSARIAHALSASKARYGLESAERLLDKKLRAGEFLPDEYDRRLAMYRRHFEPRIPIDAPDATPPLLPFAISEHTPWQTATRFALRGALLAAGPVLVSLYQYLPTASAAGRFHRLQVLSYLLTSLTGWLAIAFYLGFFFNQFRGNNGLTKGMILSGCLIAPSIALPLLNATPLLDLQPTLIWAMLAFAFCSLLGGVEDYRRLRDHGFRLRDLAALHALPGLSVYASSIAAALVSGGVSLLSGKLGDVAKLFAATVSAAPPP